MYQKSAYSGKLRNVSTNEVFAYDDRLPQFEPFLEWLSSGGQLEVVPYFEGEENEGKTKIAIEIDLEYTDKIGRLLMKHQNKKTRAEQLGQTYVIPQITLDEVEALEQECNQRIFEETGITDYAYRQSNPILAKGKIL